jgi:IS1 family transposase
MNRLPVAKRVQILSMLCEGSSMRSISRVVDVSINTVTRYLILAGEACAAFHDRTVKDVHSKRVQCDEVWSFNAMKEKTAKKKGAERPDGAGDVWTWTAIDADSKLIIGWLVGDRGAGCAAEFMNDVAGRIHGRVQLTTDGHKPYLEAVDYAFGGAVDYAVLQKIYGETTPEAKGRYSPAKCIGTKREPISGDPDPDHISTSYIERSNLTLRMANRRFTRLTNAFSKKLANHCHMIALYTVWYNFVKMHKTLKMSPALAAGVSETLWSINDLVALVDAYDAALPRKKPGRKSKAAPAQ